MKKTILSLLLTMTAMNAFADPPHLYILGQIGSATSSRGTLDTLVDSLVLNSHLFVQDKKGLTGRVGLGLDFTDYFALESGFSFYPAATRIEDPNQSIWLQPFNLPSSRSTISNIHSIDVMAKLSKKIKIVKFYITGGAAVVHASYEQAATNRVTSFNWPAGSATFVVPKFGLGLNLPLNQQLSIDMTVGATPSHGHIEQRNYLPQLNSAMVGLKFMI